ncbi:uncharacterized protein LOC134343551 [Mobula hypostoma]|uniref:uncharacterized protein LOC134343551 n=1 Tax=Mobula hypostoma TaxID=723540 RepID=UPI002FC2A72C
MPRKPQQKKSVVVKSPRDGKKKGPTAAMEPWIQVGSPSDETHFISGVEERGAMAAVAVSQKKMPELRMRKEVRMRKSTQFKLQEPTATATESDSESELDIAENTDEEEEKEPEEIGSKGDDGDIREALLQLTAELRKLRTELRDVKMCYDKAMKRQDKMDKNLQKMERTIEHINNRVEKTENNVLVWNTGRNRLLEKVDVLENFSRCNNIKIVGLKEGIEGDNPIEFFQRWIPKTL